MADNLSESHVSGSDTWRKVLSLCYTEVYGRKQICYRADYGDDYVCEGQFYKFVIKCREMEVSLKNNYHTRKKES